MARSKQASGSPSQTSEIEVGDPEARARQICLRLLTIAPRTRAHLAQALHRRGVPDEAAENVLSRFTDVGLIDDAAFARAWVESRHHSRGLSRRSLSAELRRQGVESDEIREAVETLDPEQEVATARRLVEQKLAGTRGQPPEVRVRRAAGTLAGGGGGGTSTRACLGWPQATSSRSVIRRTTVMAEGARQRTTKPTTKRAATAFAAGLADRSLGRPSTSVKATWRWFPDAFPCSRRTR